MSTDERGTVAWNVQAPRDLDAETFDAAHENRVSKATYIRTAVKEKITRGKGNKKS